MRRGEAGLQVHVMREIPANLILAEELAAHFDGFSSGSNDPTQLVLGVDRDSAEIAGLFDERDPAAKRMIAEVTGRARTCGEAPGDHPGFAAFPVEQKIDPISLNTDSFAAPCGASRRPRRGAEPICATPRPRSRPSPRSGRSTPAARRDPLE
ncbi:putative PEP-binding protein [Dankookia sp. P2]|uniref:putative PEP-binding protein n=1 Tax=Dankookia sp. P2 TaxID=3423955 RepID=UPI003D666333